MQVSEAIRGFYAVLDRDDEQLARALLASGARVLQVRIKPEVRIGAGDLVRISRMVRRLCDEAGAALIVNDRIDVALAARADGVHLGQTDLSLRDARRIVGTRLWIGVSTHSLDQVRMACAGGADYLGFGPVYATTTKRNPDAVQGLTGLRTAVSIAGGVPIVAIGGLSPELAPGAHATGAAAVCAISAVNDAADVVAAGRAMAPRSATSKIAHDSKV
jgi:thiamine-phosphate pyrophosphorylase